MGPDALLLVLVASVCHAGWNLVVKRSSATGPVFVWMFASIQVALVAPVAGWVWVSGGSIDAPGVWAAVTSGILHTGYYLVLQRAYASSDLSLVYPVARGTGPLLAVMGAVLLLGEEPGTLGLLGAVTVSAGVFIIASSSRSSGPGRVDLAGLSLALLTGLSIAAYTVWDGYAMRVLSADAVLYFWISGITRWLLLGGLVLRPGQGLRARWRTHWRDAAAVGVLGPLAYILILVAFSRAPVALVAPARELSIVIATVLGTWVLGEERGPVRSLAAGVIVLGVILLSLAEGATTY